MTNASGGKWQDNCSRFSLRACKEYKQAFLARGGSKIAADADSWASLIRHG